jgi:hypothetical protein
MKNQTQKYFSLFCALIIVFDTLLIPFFAISSPKHFFPTQEEQLNPGRQKGRRKIRNEIIQPLDQIPPFPIPEPTTWGSGTSYFVFNNNRG